MPWGAVAVILSDLVVKDVLSADGMATATNTGCEANFDVPVAGLERLRVDYRDSGHAADADNAYDDNDDNTVADNDDDNDDNNDDDNDADNDDNDDAGALGSTPPTTALPDDVFVQHTWASKASSSAELPVHSLVLAPFNAKDPFYYPGAAGD